MGTPVMSKKITREGDRRFRMASCGVNGRRPSMEDSHAVDLREPYGLFAIFDGHDSAHCSSFLGQNFAGAMREAWDAHPPLGEEGVRDVCLALDRQYIESNPNETSGSTATFTFIFTDEEKPILLVGNVGDSRVLVGRESDLVFVTLDHKPNNEEETRRIVEAQGCVEENRVDGMLAVSRAFGDADFKRVQTLPRDRQRVIPVPEVTRVVCEPGDFVLLCCDGVFESGFSSDQVIEFVYSLLPKTDDLAVICALLCEEAVSRGSNDNVSCMLVLFDDGSAAASGVTDDFVPGPYVLPDSPQFCDAYEAMAKASNLTIGQALERRYDILQACLERGEPLPLTLGEQLTDGPLGELRHERLLFGDGPPVALAGEERSGWFDRMASRSSGRRAYEPEDEEVLKQKEMQGFV